MLLAVIGLVLLGIIMVFSSSSVVAYRDYGDPYFFFKRHIFFVCAGSVVLLALWKLPLKDGLNSKWVYLLLIVVFLFLLATLTPLGHKAGGAKRWLKLGPISIQPLEFTKVILVLYLAYFFSNKRHIVDTSLWGFIIPLLITSVLSLPLLFQPDFGGFLFLFLIFIALSFIGGVRLTYLSSFVFLLGTVASILLYLAPYRWNRFLAYIHSLKGMNFHYQIKQSIYALGSGGFWGVGLGESKQKLFYLPQASTDFVMSILGEEMGFVGMSFVFICLGIIVLVTFINAIQRENLWDRLVIVGMGMILILGAFLHIAVVLGAVPPKGTPMPFISYGGSNLLVMFICVGFLLNAISNER